MPNFFINLPLLRSKSNLADSIFLPIALSDLLLISFANLKQFFLITKFYFIFVE